MSNIQLKFIRHAIKQENMSLNQEKNNRRILKNDRDDGISR